MGFLLLSRAFDMGGNGLMARISVIRKANLVILMIKIIIRWFWSLGLTRLLMQNERVSVCRPKLNGNLHHGWTEGKNLCLG